MGHGAIWFQSHKNLTKLSSFASVDFPIKWFGFKTMFSDQKVLCFKSFSRSSRDRYIEDSGIQNFHEDNVSWDWLPALFDFSDFFILHNLYSCILYTIYMVSVSVTFYIFQSEWIYCMNMFLIWKFKTYVKQSCCLLFMTVKCGFI